MKLITQPDVQRSSLNLWGLLDDLPRRAMSLKNISSELINSIPVQVRGKLWLTIKNKQMKRPCKISHTPKESFGQKNVYEAFHSTKIPAAFGGKLKNIYE